MKVESIPNHSFKHIWEGYVRKLLLANPEYSIKKKPHFHTVEAVVIKTPKGNVKEEIISYTLFKGILERFLVKSKQCIINGEAINIPHCGMIAAKRIERDFRAQNKSIDWKKTSEAGHTIDENGKKKFNHVFYYLSDEYCRIGWYKPLMTNVENYLFEPTRSSSKTHITNVATTGFKEEFSQALMSDPFLKYKYIFCPIRDYVPNQ